MLITRSAIYLASAAMSLVSLSAQGIVRDVPSNTPSTGAWTMNFTLPASSSLNGARVVAQSVHLNPALPQLVATSNGVRFVIGPAQP